MTSTENIIAIRKRNPELALSTFAELMNRTVVKLNKMAADNIAAIQKLTPAGVEKICVEAMKSVCDGVTFSPDDIVLISGQSFPDILATHFYGVEVKTTQSDHWKSTGSSIIESTRKPEVERIFMLFGKLGGAPEFRCRPYEECLYDITVTHSPRYLIDMETDTSNTIFAKMGIDYDSLRLSNHSIADVRKYYRTKALKENRKEMPWWLSEDQDQDAGMMIKLWDSISQEEKAHIKIQMLILFPEQIIGRNYSEVALWLVAYYKIVCPNVRDIFSAGGQAKYLNGNLLSKPAPAITKRFLDAVDPAKRIISEDMALIEVYNPGIIGQNCSVFDAWTAQVDSALRKKFGSHVKFKEWVVAGDTLQV